MMHAQKMLSKKMKLTIIYGACRINVTKQYTPLNSTMESSALFYTLFLWCLLLSITGYSIYVGFGPPSKELRDPFEEHED